MKAYHFIPGNKISYLDKISEHLKHNNFNIILDLEDAVNDVNNTAHAKIIKDSARENILQYFTNEPKKVIFLLE